MSESPKTKLVIQQFLALLLLYLLGLTLVAWPRDPGPAVYELGAVQTTTIIAEMDFPVLKDPDERERERARSLESVPAVVVREDSASVSAYARLVWVRTQVGELRDRESEGTETDDLGAEKNELVLSFSQPTLIALLLGTQSDELLNQAELLLQDVMQRGYVDQTLAAELSEHSAVRILDPLGSATIPSEQVLTADRVREFARARAVQRGLPHSALSELVLHCAIPNLVPDPSSTTALREEAFGAVEPHTRIVRKGEKIIGGHELITPEVLRVLRSYEYWKGQGGYHEEMFQRMLPPLGDLLLVTVMVGAFAAYLWIHRRSVVSRPADFWLLFVIEAAILAFGFVLVRVFELPHLLVPVSAVSILVTLFFDVRLAVAASLLPVFLIGLVADGGTYFIAIVGVGVVIAVLLTPSLRQRTHFYRVLGAVASVHLMMLVGLSLSDGAQLEIFTRDAASAVANPLLATAVVLLVLPISEMVFHRSTDLSLFELVDLNRPVLRRLLLAAPGTYHHSIMVGALAESAAQRIGANPLLARVVGYYHDIGKLGKPDHFSENVQFGRKSPRDKLNPSMARLILERHVREGVTLAQEERLPREVIEGVAEHHGSTLMRDVFERAISQDPEATEGSFRYPGPSPSSRESALVFLANQVDSRTRGLDEPSPSRIKGIVIEVVRESLESGDLDGSGLSLSDLAQIRDSFTTMLVAAFLGRVSTGKRSEE